MLKKVIALLLCVMMAIGALGLVGCRDPFNDEELGVDEVEDKVTIRFGYLTEEKDLAVTIKREFEKDNDTINLKMEPISGDWKSQMNKYIAKPEDFPDIIWVPGDQHSAYSSGGAFVNLRSRMEADEATKLDNYYESMIETTHYSAEDDGIWYAPRDYNKPVTYVNVDMFEAVGIDLEELKQPGVWNYEKFLEVCQIFREKMDANSRDSADFDQEAYAIGIEPNSFPVESEMQWNPVYHAAVKDFGGTMIDTELSGQEAIKVDTDATINAYKKIYTDLFASRFSYGPQDGTTSTAFLSSKAAMWFNVRPKLPTIRNRNINVDFLPMPFDVIGAGNSGYAITSVAKDRLSTEGGNTKNNEDLAWEVIKWLITEPGQQALGRSGAGIPVLKSLKNSGDWIDENDPSLNHTAFTAYEERDMGLNIFNIYKPQNHKVMFDTMTLIITAAISPNSWEKQGEEYVMSSRFVNDLNTYKQEMLAKAE